MGGFASLGISLPLLLAFVINFIILLVLLKKFLYKPVLNMLDERTKKGEGEHGVGRSDETRL